MELAPKTKEFFEEIEKCDEYEFPDIAMYDLLYKHSGEALNAFAKEFYEVGLVNRDPSLIFAMVNICNAGVQFDPFDVTVKDGEAFVNDDVHRERVMSVRDMVRFDIAEVNWIDSVLDKPLVHNVSFMDRAMRNKEYDFIVGVDKRLDSMLESEYNNMRQALSHTILRELAKTEDKIEQKKLGDCLTEVYRGYQEGSEILPSHSLTECREQMLRDNMWQFAISGRGVFGKETDETVLNQSSLRMMSKRFFGTPGLHGDEKAVSGLVNMIDCSLKLLQESDNKESDINKNDVTGAITNCLSEITKFQGTQYNQYFVQALDRIDEEIYVNATNIKSIDFLANLVSDPSLEGKRFFEMLEMNSGRISGVVKSIALNQDLGDVKYKRVMAHFVDHWKDDKEILELVAQNRFMKADSRSDIAAFAIGQLDKLGVSFKFTDDVLPEIGARNGFTSRSEFGDMKIDKFNRELFAWSMSKGLDVNKHAYYADFYEDGDSWDAGMDTVYSKIFKLGDSSAIECVERMANVDWNSQLLVAVAQRNVELASKCISNGAEFDEMKFKNDYHLLRVCRDHGGDYEDHPEKVKEFLEEAYKGVADKMEKVLSTSEVKQEKAAKPRIKI